MERKLGAYIVGFIALFIFTLFAQGEGEVSTLIRNIQRGIQSGNVQLISKYLADRVEASILNKEGDFGKEQVSFMLKEFFTKYPPASFSILHRGKAGDTHYVIGTYSSTMGNFDVNIFISSRKDGYKIEQIRFERNN